MKEFLKSTKGKLCVAALAVCLVAAAALIGYSIWLDGKPKFRNLTVNASAGEVTINQFFTEYANEKRAAWVTDPASIDYDVMGDHTITLKHGKKEETVVLTIVDDLAPVLKLRDVVITADQPIGLDAFIAEVTDHSEFEVAFAQEYAIPADYSDLIVTVKAVDAQGNETTQTAVASFIWAKEAAVLELGQTLDISGLLYMPESEGVTVAQEELDLINSAQPGEYELTLTAGENTAVCKIIVQDTLGPVLEVREHNVYVYGYVKLEDFLVDARDPSGVKEVRMVTVPDTRNPGDLTIVIEGEDNLGNITTVETVLHVVTDRTPPVINGISKELTVPKNGTPNYLAGVSAADDRDGAVAVTYDDSAVDLSKAGTYYVTYSATDKSGNTKTAKRRVVVTHNQEDTNALVATLAGQLENDPEKIRDFVRTYISYSTNWGGNDPVWFGFQNRHGNCYVHALTLKALLDYKGYNTQLIWVTNKTHYWLIIQMPDGSWRHIDATPSNTHSIYSLMTDAQRLSTLSGRDWDHSGWPACE